MTNEEAIRNIIAFMYYAFEDIPEEVGKAFDLAIKSLQERPTGEWIFHKANEEQTDGYECSVCKTTYHTRVPYFSEFNFCPNCGAKMKGAEK